MNLDDTFRYFLRMAGVQQAQQVVFDATQGFNREEAREIYRASQAHLAEGSYLEALSGYRSLEKVYPGLLDLLLIREGEAYAGIPDEGHVQFILKRLLKERPDSALSAQASYQLAQSYLRTRDDKAAREIFERVRDQFPGSDYAIGSLYYLGGLYQKAGPGKDNDKALSLWLAYLEKSPNGRFAAEIASQLDERLESPTVRESELIGLGLAQGERNWKRALTHLERAPVESVWLELATAQLKNRQEDAGIQTLIRGIPQSKDPQRLQEGVDMLVRNTNKASAIQKLRQLSAKPLPENGDYVLWKLSQLNPGGSAAYFWQIVKDYPDGDYAPESSWQLIWPLLRSGRHQDFLRESAIHMTKYPYALSASKVLFWRGKLLEKAGQIHDATSAYREILAKYPASYYAFRASGRLAVLIEGKDDPGWKVEGAQRVYPPEEKQGMESLLAGLHFPKSAVTPHDLESRVHELAMIGSAEDLALILDAELGAVPPSIASWREHVNGDRAKGIRLIRDDLSLRARNGDLSGLNPSPAEMRLLYPLYFSDVIAREAPKNKLDPFLVQSLMREESYFNELAVSGSNALGLMQLLPSTAQEVARWEGLSGFQPMNLFQPEVNVRLGSRYLGHLHQLFNGNSMLSVGAYNGGPNVMKRWVQASTTLHDDPDLFVEMIPYDQTRNYIKKVYSSYWNYSRLYGS